jgi:DNA polymerase III subunit delta'
MSMTAERTRTGVAEPDRLEGFSAPREVNRLFGHDAALREFADALASGRMHHAWLIVGPEGVGKATLAYHFARMVLAERDAAYQGKAIDADHLVFRKVAALSHPNLLLLRRSFNEKTKRYSQFIGVDEVRRLKTFLGNTAGEEGWRVVIVDRADDLNQNAANALLKALEEPPPRTLFILISSAEGHLPVTIRSRTRILRVAALGDEDLEKAVRAALARDDQGSDPERLATALALSDGSVRRALELVSGEGIELYGEIVAFFAALPELDGARLHRLVERIGGFSNIEQLELFIALLLGVIERLIRFTAAGEGATREEKALAKRLISQGNLSQWAEAWEAISEAKAEALEYNLDRSLLVLETWFRLQRLAREHLV